MLKYTYLELGDFFSNLEKLKVETIEEHNYINDNLLDKYSLDRTIFYDLFAGNLDYNINKCYSQSYAGHQFGHLNVLGDGRSLMLGEVNIDNKLYDLQFKGSGATKFSRGGDGKLTLEAAYKELFYSEALNGLNINTTRIASIFLTKEHVVRQTLEPGALITRFASSHVRVATFYNAFYYGSFEEVKKLADYSITRHFDFLKGKENKYELMFEEIIKLQAKLMSEFQAQGFVHGVLNTDNVLISGEAIDFGPCAFMDKFSFDKVFSSIDQDGRYKFSSQKSITKWNLTRLGESLSELFKIDVSKVEDFINEKLNKFDELYDENYYEIMTNKLGGNVSREQIDYLLDLMNRESLNYHNVFKYLTHDIDQRNEFSTNKRLHKFRDSIEFDKELMSKYNPTFIMSNVIFEEVINNSNYISQVLEFLSEPFKLHDGELFYYLNSLEDVTGYVTYCNT